MSQQFNPKRVLRQISKPLLREFFEHQGHPLDVEWDQLSNTQVDDIFDAWQGLPDAQRKAEQWWKQRSFEPVPETAEEAVELACDNRIAKAVAITVRRVSGETFDRVVGYALEEKPEPRTWRDPEPAYVIPDDEIPF